MNTRKTIINILKAIMRGTLLLSMRIDKIFIHIVYLFAVVWVSIYVSLKIEETLRVVEKNNGVLESLRIEHAQKTSELAGFDRVSTIHRMLEDAGSEVTFPEKPAAHID